MFSSPRQLVSIKCLFVFIVIAASTTFAQLTIGTNTGLGGQNRVSGMVLAPDGQRILNRIAVKILTEQRGERVAFTDDNGNFLFTGLVSGDYTILIDKIQDFETYTYPVTIRQRSGFPAENVLVNIRLNYKKGVARKPGVINARFADVPKHALELYSNGVDLAKKGDRKAAIEQLQKAISEYDKFTDAYNEMGVQYLGLGQFGPATEAFQAALKIDPKAYGPMMNFGMALFLMKRYPDADPVLRAAVAMKEDQAVPHYFLGQNTAYLGKFDEAEKELQLAIKLSPEQVKEAYRLLAIIHFSQGKKSEAADDLESYLRLNPKAPDADQLKKSIATYRQ